MQIYVANLAAYNNGKLKGAWVEPSSDVDELWEQIAEALGGDEDDEWAVHDYDGFPNLGEHPSVKDIAKVASMIEEHGDAAFAAISETGVRYLDQAESLLENGFAVFHKHADEALEEYAQDMADEGVLDKEWLLQYVDWERVARDLSMDLHVVEHDGKTYIFNE